MYVLIFIAWMAGFENPGGPTVSSVEFSSREKCEAAKTSLTEQYKAWAPKERLSASTLMVCVEK